MALDDNIDPLSHTHKFSGVLKNFFFTRPADRAGRESTTLTTLFSQTAFKNGKFGAKK